jgi:hypothetical protein
VVRRRPITGERIALEWAGCHELDAGIAPPFDLDAQGFHEREQLASIMHAALEPEVLGCRSARQRVLFPA